MGPHHLTLFSRLPCAPDQAHAQLTFSVNRNPIDEADNMCYRFVLGARGGLVSVDVIRGSAEPGDFVAWSGSAWLQPNSNQWRCGVTIFRTEEDDDTDHETLILVPRLDGVQSGWVELIIRDDDAVPAAPVGLTATPRWRGVALTWRPPPIDAITGWELQQGSVSAPWHSIQPTGSGGAPHTHVVSGLTNGTVYRFQVRAKNSVGSGVAASVSATPGAFERPEAPTGLTAVAGWRGVTLTWTAPSGPFTRYDVQQRSSGGWGEWTDTGSLAPTTWVGNLTNGTRYSFRVRAVNTQGSDGAGPPSNVATATPLVAPGAPTGLRATDGDAQVTLAWTAATGGGAVTRYEYRQRSGSGGYGRWRSAGSGTTHTVGSLTNLTAYTFQVRAWNV